MSGRDSALPIWQRVSEARAIVVGLHRSTVVLMLGYLWFGTGNPLGPEEHRADAELSDYSMGNGTYVFAPTGECADTLVFPLVAATKARAISFPFLFFAFIISFPPRGFRGDTSYVVFRPTLATRFLSESRFCASSEEFGQPRGNKPEEMHRVHICRSRKRKHPRTSTDARYGVP